MLKTKKISTEPKQLLVRIKQIFPSVSWSDFQYIDEGWDHEVIILDKKLVFRFPNDNEYLTLLKTEVAVLRQVQPLVSSVSIPDYSYVAPDYSFAGYAFIHGRALTGQYFATLPEAEKAEVAKKLADFLSVMHTAIQKGHDFRGVPASDMAETQSEDRRLTKVYLSSTLSADDYELVEVILDDTDAVLAQDSPTVLLHGDIYNAHLLWDAGKNRLGIIDFSDMNLGDPAFDFAELYEYGADFVRQVYQHYTGPKDATFLNRALVYQKWVGVFMMVDHFVHQKTTFEKACETFERVKYL